MQDLKRHLISAGRVFASSFITVLLATLTSGGVQWTGAFWLSVIVAGVSAGLKAILDPAIPVQLGGKKED